MAHILCIRCLARGACAGQGLQNAQSPAREILGPDIHVLAGLRSVVRSQCQQYCGSFQASFDVWQ